jgi:hypothetical protein
MLLCIRHSTTVCWNLRMGMPFELQYKTNIWIDSCKGRRVSHIETADVGYIIVMKCLVISDQTGVRTVDVSSRPQEKVIISQRR